MNNGASSSDMVALPQDDSPEPDDYPSSPARRTCRTARMAVVTAIVVACVAAVSLGVELYVRKRIAVAIDTATSCLVQDNASASLGAEPLLLQLLSGHIDHVTITTAGNRIMQARQMTVVVTARDISLQKEGDSLGTIGRIDVQVSWPAAGMTESARSLPSLPGLAVRDVTTSAATGLITVNVVTAVGRLIPVPLRPVVANGVVAVRPGDPVDIPGASSPMIPLPWDILTVGASQNLLNFRAQEIKVTDSGITVKLSASDQPITASNGPCLQSMSF